MHISRILGAAGLAAGLLSPRAGHAQFALGTTYLELGPGLALQPDGDGRTLSRDPLGVGGFVAIGRDASPHLAFEGRITYEHFGQPNEIIPPCGVGVNCRVPAANGVDNTTIGIDAHFATGHTTPALLAIAGLGARIIHQYPTVDEHRVTPYGELGAGVTVPLGIISLVADARIQASPERLGLPRWTAPFTLGLRF